MNNAFLRSLLSLAQFQHQPILNNGMTTEKAEAIKNTVNQVWQQQAVDWSNGDIDSYMSVYWNSDKLRFASGNSVVYGWQTTRERYKKRYHNRDLMGKLSFTPIDIMIYTENDAVIFGRYRLDRVEDSTPKSYEGLVTTTFRKMSDSQWKIVCDHTSS